MLFRNLMSMDVEESIRANPIDGVVLLSGCDKTTPAQLMGAASVDLPAIMVTGGPMLNGKYRGQDIGSGTMVWQFSEEVRGGKKTWDDFFEAEAGQSRSNGHCMTMGTASTMASMAEALGIAPTGNAAIPAVDSRRYALAQLSGRRIVEMVREDLRMSKILTRDAFENAIRVNAAIGGSTNAVVHLLAIAGRIGVPLELDDFDKLAHDLPLLVDLQPSGRFLMEDFYYAGGVPAVVRELGDLIHRDALTVGGKTIGEDDGRRAVLEPRGDRDARRAGEGARGDRDPARQPRAERRGDQTVGGDGVAADPPRPRGRVREHRRLSKRASTIPISTSTKRACSCSKARARAVIRGCRRPATCRCRRRSSRKALPTWCASPTRA